MAKKKAWLSTRQVVEEYGFYLDRWWKLAKAGVVVTRRVKGKGREGLQGRNGNALRFSRASIEAYMTDKQGWLTTEAVRERYGYSRVFWRKRANEGAVVAHRGNWRDGRKTQYEEASIEDFLATKRNGHCRLCGLEVKDMVNHLRSREHRHQERVECRVNDRLVLGGISYPA